MPTTNELAVQMPPEGLEAPPLACHDELSGRGFQAQPGIPLLDAALAQGVDLPHGCRVGACGACAFQAVGGAENLEPPDALEADSLERFGLPPDHRLACRARTRGPVRLRPLG